ncbi:MAG: hypothetical protein QNJ44_17550 [Rhodobacter sp.]|nr:hypothetical protein [Rhodobacter sp.]
MSRRTFFVATPYGNESGEPEDRATYDLITGLRTNIIEAAVARCRAQGYDIEAVFGSDRVSGDNIWDKIGNDLSAAHGVIGVIASDKPNTYIEIGLAFGLWYTPILLHFVDHDMPSDLKGTEVGEFTRGQALGTEDASAVVDWLAIRMLSDPPRHNRAVPGYLPDTTSATGRVRTYDRFSKAIDSIEWSDTLWNAEREIILAGPKLFKLHGQSWSGRPGPDGARADASVTLGDILIEKAVKDGVDITVVMPHPDAVSERDLKRPVDEDSLDDFRIDLRRSRKRWATIEDSIARLRATDPAEDRERPIGKLRVVQTRHCHFPHRLTMTDKRMLLTLRFYREDVNSRFCIDAGPQYAEDAFVAPIFDLIRSDIDVILDEDGGDPGSDDHAPPIRRDGS